MRHSDGTVRGVGRRHITRVRLVFAVMVIAVSVASVQGDVPAASAQVPALSPVARCLRRAVAATDLIDEQSVRLCAGATSEQPVVCFVQATETLLLAEVQGIALCQCATSLAPVDCVRRLRAEARYTEPELVEMCSAAASCGITR